MKKTAASLLVYALEQIGVKRTFGIPGVHTTEIYDELNSSKQIEPILVTHELGAAFMADATSRTSGSIGTLVIVPAAGMTHAMSGIGEAYLDGVPMLIISGGTRRDSGKSYQLHQLDQGKILDGIIKKYYLLDNHKDVVQTIYDAYEIAISGEPGPVFIEVPVELQLFKGECDKPMPYVHKEKSYMPDPKQLREAIDLLLEAKNPGIYVGWGAVDAGEETKQIAELLAAPVATTIQGLSAMPANHPMHTGVGFGASATPTGQKAFANCDAMLAVGVRFSELATGSYGVDVPENLIHVDINPEVFDKNYPTKIKIEGDGKQILAELLAELKKRDPNNKVRFEKLNELISTEKKKYMDSWLKKKQNDQVSPGFFFDALRKQMPDDTMVVVDDGKHTFLTAELMPIFHARHFISPSDFNSMGYCTPASISTKLANPDKTVIGIVGDGAFMMTGLEFITARTYELGIILFVFHDGELGQISQFQKIPLNRKTATIIGDINIEGVALAVGAEYIRIESDNEIDYSISQALSLAKENKSVLVDVNIDYSRKTFLTKGVIKTNLGRFSLPDKIRMISRAAKRHLLG